jgi:xylulose-5-phosphate/fructose-6-phosphate phosphoketolase
MPLAEVRSSPEHLRLLEGWTRSYRPEELFDPDRQLNPELAALAPAGDRRMGANPHANGGLLLKELVLPDFRDYAVAVPRPGTVTAEATRIAGRFLRDVMKLNAEAPEVDGESFAGTSSSNPRCLPCFEMAGRERQ